ncbi:mandelate racemase [Actinomycetospora sp. NBRC 106375]|uniref:enolase C-terminal domain-like protein n=1 Tax=Actinomycetospora sp. NBRC 106375 TaxID=3032207 RepID=UPI0024A507FE|nr:enolase C-terminal domain-like protein [Actinomycetospora sp. NBRC 106375]GLZ49784.1 mandelate racemase [Actinomycetospora sp. NBRC 106375]
MSAPGHVPALTLRAVDARLVQVPMRRPLHTSAGRMTHAPLALLDVHTEQGITGRSYLFCYLEPVGRAVLALTREVAGALVGLSAQPAALRRVLTARYKLAGVGGPIAGLLAGLDMACWDALAIAAQLPLVRLLGADPRPVPAYNSNGLGPAATETVAAEAAELAAEGMAAVKLRLGRTVPEDDRDAVEAVRRALPRDVAIMADYNQALDLPSARQRCGQLDELGLTWIEEPIRHDDYTGAAELTAELRTPIQIGENFAGPRAMSTALASRASDLVMPDVDRIGGVTGWLQAAALADVAAIPMSNHLYPEISTHLLAATPTAHWLEYVDWAAPVLREPLDVTTGAATPPDRPGTGIEWDEEAVARYRLA